MGIENGVLPINIITNVSHKHLIGRLFRLISGLDLIASRHSHKTHHSLELQS